MHLHLLLVETTIRGPITPIVKVTGYHINFPDKNLALFFTDLLYTYYANDQRGVDWRGCKSVITVHG